MRKTENSIVDGVIWKQLLLFFFPILIGTFFQQLYNTVDTVVVGQYVGKQALAAVGTTGTVINLLVGFFVGLSSGATVIIAQFWGSGDKDRVSKTVHTGIAMSIAGGAILMVIGVVFAPTILGWMNTPEDVIDPRYAEACHMLERIKNMLDILTCGTPQERAEVCLLYTSPSPRDCS